MRTLGWFAARSTRWWPAAKRSSGSARRSTASRSRPTCSAQRRHRSGPRGAEVRDSPSWRRSPAAGGGHGHSAAISAACHGYREEIERQCWRWPECSRTWVRPLRGAHWRRVVRCHPPAADVAAPGRPGIRHRADGSRPRPAPSKPRSRGAPASRGSAGTGRRSPRTSTTNSSPRASFVPMPRPSRRLESG